MKNIARTVVLLVLLAAALPAGATIGTLDDVPAATLLLPYFEVDLSDTYQGPVTILSISNASATAVVAHVTLWTDRGVPTRSTDIYLTGYDMEWVDLRLLFNGIPPVSADDEADPADVISNHGPLSQDINFPGTGPCAGPLTRWSVAEVEALRAAHTGQPSGLFAGACGATDHGDGIARGFVTIDTVNECTPALPTAPGYFTGSATAQNVLFGQYWIVDRALNFAYGDALTAIEADDSDPLTDGAGDYTFYGRLANVNGTGADHREALPVSWMGRFLKGGPFEDTSALVWRDAWPASTFNCAAPPAGLDQAQLVIFDEQENIFGPGAGDPFPLAASRVRLGSSPELTLYPDFGFIYYNLQRATPAAPFGVVNQSLVTHAFASYGRFAGAHPTWAMATVSAPPFTMHVFQCSNGIDDDGDGLVDFPADPGCFDGSSGEAPACDNKVDDDGDDLIDFPADPGCFAAWYWSEVDPV